MFTSNKRKGAHDSQREFENESGTSQEEMATLIDLQTRITQMSLAFETMKREHEAQIVALTQNFNQFQNAPMPTEYDDAQVDYNNGNEIKLDSFKALPTFNGDKAKYRSWRSLVEKMFNSIQNFNRHPNYVAALDIVRAKIIDGASDLLENNNTKRNIGAILSRLDFSYADQRPLYVIESEMTSIKQGNRTLHEFYDSINQALNLVVSKINMTYPNEASQKDMLKEANQKAIRTFIMGSNNQFIRSTLYGNSPKTMAQAYAIAQTIFYDNQHLNLDHHTEKRHIERKPAFNNQNHKPNFVEKPRFNPNFNYPKPNQQSTQAPYKQPKPEPMEVDTSRQFKNTTQFKQPYQQYGQKREFQPSGNNIQQTKFQRYHEIRDASEAGEDPQEQESNQVEYDEYEIQEDQISCHSEVSSAFLGK